MLHDEPYVTLGQAAAKFPGHRGAKRLHTATLTRWILAGVRSIDGRRVKLEAVRLGGRWLTSEAALRRFADQLACPDAETPPRSSAARSAASQRADAALRQMGA